MKQETDAEKSLRLKAPPSRKRMSGQERRQQLITIALELFSRNGFSGTPLHKIASAAGVSEAIIYRHFSTKEEFYSAILEDEMDRSQTAEWVDELKVLAGNNDDEGVVRSIAEKILKSYGDNPHFQRLMLYASLEGHEIAPLFQRSWGMPIFELLREYILRRQKDGSFRPVDPGIAVHVLVSIPVYHAMVTKLFGTDVLQVTDAAFVDQIVALMLHGLVPDQPPGAKDKNPRRTSKRAVGGTRKRNRKI